MSLLGIVCVIALSGPGPSTEENSENQLLSIRLESAKASYALGELVTVKVYIINHGNETQRFYGGVRSHDFTVLDSEGKFVIESMTIYDNIEGCFLEAPAQSEIFADTIQWHQNRIDPTPNELKHVAPGIYLIKAAIRLMSGSFTSQLRIRIAV
jgi:hypothetical protein